MSFCTILPFFYHFKQFQTSHQTKPSLCKLIQEINELNDTKAMVDKDHLTHMLDMAFRADILQRDLVIIKINDGGQEGEADLFAILFRQICSI